jgi:hypothetical protein
VDGNVEGSLALKIGYTCWSNYTAKWPVARWSIYTDFPFFYIGKCDDMPAPHLASWGVNHRTSGSPSDFS